MGVAVAHNWRLIQWCDIFKAVCDVLRPQSGRNVEPFHNRSRNMDSLQHTGDQTAVGLSWRIDAQKGQAGSCVIAMVKFNEMGLDYCRVLHMATICHLVTIHCFQILEKRDFAPTMELLLKKIPILKTISNPIRVWEMNRFLSKTLCFIQKVTPSLINSYSNFFMQIIIHLSIHFLNCFIFVFSGTI